MALLSGMLTHRVTLGSVVVAVVLSTTAIAAAADRDNDGVDDTEQRASACGRNAERPICDDLLQSFIEGDLVRFLRIAAVDDAHPVRIVRRRGATTHRTAAGLERAINARGGLRAFFSGRAHSVGTRIRLGGRGAALDHEVTVGDKSALLRFERDVRSVYHLVSITFR